MTILDLPIPRLLDRSVISSLSRELGTEPKSVLMFSGGRDSTVGALRMHEQGLAPILVTVSSWHLAGIERVQERVREIRRSLSIRLPWLVVRQPGELRVDTSFYEQTCLPCHHAYVVAGAVIAAKPLASGALGLRSVHPAAMPARNRGLIQKPAWCSTERRACVPREAQRTCRAS